MYIPHDYQLYLKRASATTAGSGIAAGGIAAKNSGGDERSTRFILGFGIGVPILLILIGAVWYFRRRRARKAAVSAKKNMGNGGVTRPKRGWKRKRKSRWRGFGWPERLKPVPAPAAYRKSDKDILPTML
ncbi:hypothetical protein LEL_09691 [Akanthomyces lecanii RCEF 1005]|uniref:Uncharacterized protein n=1 Tax=Akanthomyces lecanii RCEF 1005 TaxID=1081108 RepID=A0A168C959_CORDF|nr:hypothetical protein LEL_09691 [Akanthomyces lecanii RCEF 1005]